MPEPTVHVTITHDYDGSEILGVYTKKPSAISRAKQSKDPHHTYVQTWRGNKMIATWGPAKEYKPRIGRRGVLFASSSGLSFTPTHAEVTDVWDLQD
jgi:hypothetical protein